VAPARGGVLVFVPQEGGLGLCLLELAAQRRGLDHRAVVQSLRLRHLQREKKERDEKERDEKERGEKERDEKERDEKERDEKEREGGRRGEEGGDSRLPLFSLPLLQHSTNASHGAGVARMAGAV